MATRVDTVQSLIEGLQFSDPRLYDALKLLVNGMVELQNEVFPILESISQITTLPIPGTATGFNYSTSPRILRLFWDATPDARFYEIRRGSDWATAVQITIVAVTEVRLDPIPSGVTRYLLKALNGNGVPSANSTYVDVIISNPGTTTVTGRVIDNNVLLSWSVPTSIWEIDYYIVKRNGQSVGNQKGTFAVIFETVAGTFLYSITPVDLAGNVGPESTISLTVNQPPDFELQDYRVSILDGLKINALVIGSPYLGWKNDVDLGWDTDLLVGQDWTWDNANTGKLLVCVGTEEYDNHFTDRAWDQPSDQVGLGYPIYIQPGFLTAKYQEIINYGTVIPDTILNINYTLEQLVTTGTVAANSTIEFSLDNLTWTPVINGKSAFGSNFQYARITVNFTSSNDKALAVFSSLIVTLDVKKEVDSGSVIANANDVDGTLVTFNKQFKDIDSLTATPGSSGSIEPLKVVINFVDIPNPTHFYVFVFDETGYRRTYTVAWKARGIT